MSQRATEPAAKSESKLSPLEVFQRRWFAVDRARATFCRESGISSSMLSVLLALDEDRVALMQGTTGVAKLLGVVVSAAGETVRQIEKAGLVERTSLFALKHKKKGGLTTDEWGDPNVKSIVMTPKGRLLLSNYLSAMNRAYRSVPDPVPEGAAPQIAFEQTRTDGSSPGDGKAAKKKVTRVQKESRA